MTNLGKFPTFFLLIVLAALCAAIFGALHNQLSYSVGPGYFHIIKFPQFDLPADIAPRLGAAIVGAQASWLMGAIIGIPAFIYGLVRVPTARTYLAAGLGSTGPVVFLSASAALLGFVSELVLAAPGWLADLIPIPADIDRAEFLRAGMMHEASYLGGALGALVAFWPMYRAAAIDRARLTGARP